MSNDQALEDRINELRLNAPRVTFDHVQSLVRGSTFTRLPSQKKLTCEVTLRNGFTVTGESSVVSVANYNQEIGERISKERAVNQIWLVEGYLLQEKLYQRALNLVEPEDLGYHVRNADGTPHIRRNVDDKIPYVTLDGGFTARDLRYFLAHLEMQEEADDKKAANAQALLDLAAKQAAHEQAFAAIPRKGVAQVNQGEASIYLSLGHESGSGTEYTLAELEVIVQELKNAKSNAG